MKHFRRKKKELKALPLVVLFIVLLQLLLICNVSNLSVVFCSKDYAKVNVTQLTTARESVFMTFPKYTVGYKYKGKDCKTQIVVPERLGIKTPITSVRVNKFCPDDILVTTPLHQHKASLVLIVLELLVVGDIIYVFKRRKKNGKDKADSK
jgi:hypothetical protein